MKRRGGRETEREREREKKEETGSGDLVLIATARAADRLRNTGIACFHGAPRESFDDPRNPDTPVGGLVFSFFFHGSDEPAFLSFSRGSKLLPASSALIARGSSLSPLDRIKRDDYRVRPEPNSVVGVNRLHFEKLNVP